MRFLPRYATFVNPRTGWRGGVCRQRNYISLMRSMYTYKLYSVHNHNASSGITRQCTASKRFFGARLVGNHITYKSHLFLCEISFFFSFVGTLTPGCTFIGCDICSLCFTTRAISMRISEQIVRCDTKTKDNVFVRTYLPFPFFLWRDMLGRI